MVHPKDLVKYCTNCKSDKKTACISKIVDKKYTNGKERVLYVCEVCKAISIYENNVLINVDKY